MSADTFERIDLFDPDNYVEAPPHEAFEHLRRTDPVHRQEMPDGTWYWAVLRHADVVHVSRNHEMFSAERGGVILEDQPPERLEQSRNQLLQMDPPRHTGLRKSVFPSFKPVVLAELEDSIRSICRGLMDKAADLGDVEFVHQIASYLPSQVIGELMAIPSSDWMLINDWAERITGGQDPELNPDYEVTAVSDASRAMTTYGIEYAAGRRAGNLDDATDVGARLLVTTVDGHPMTDVQFGSFFTQLVVAGNDTTRTMLSSGLLALLQHPEQFALLREDLSLIPSTIEEILRWANPLHYFRRTATADTTLAGVPIAAGEKLAMVYTSANRDDAVFDEPHAFDIRRSPNPHLSFGIGPHFCLGAPLARLEGRVFFEELLRRFPTIELTGEPERQRSNLNNALKRLPVRFSVGGAS
ncbi:MAG: cytochrome P450 [Acidimicrobiales bacterium]|nr:cytochrome P450 [Acidimicrobiales bacterium]